MFLNAPWFLALLSKYCIICTPTVFFLNLCVRVSVRHIYEPFQSTDHAGDLKPGCSPDVCIMESWTFQSVTVRKAHSENEESGLHCNHKRLWGRDTTQRWCRSGCACLAMRKKQQPGASWTPRGAIICPCFLHMTKTWCALVCFDWLLAGEILRGVKASVIKTSPLISVHIQRWSQYADRLLQKK